MPVSPLEVTLDLQQFQQVRARLRDAGEGGLLRELNKAIKSAALEVKVAEQTAARGLPATGNYHTGLRESIAAATAIRVSDSKTSPGVRVYVSEAKVRGHLGRETNRRSWRHPVYGNRKAWVTQVSDPGWWDRTGQAHFRSVYDKVKQALQDTADKMARG